MVFIAAFVLFFVSMQKRVGRGPVFRGKADKLNGVIPALSKLTFGIYLIHPMFLGVFNDLFGRFYLPGIIRTPAEVLVIFAVCAAVIWVISKIPVLNKYII